MSTNVVMQKKQKLFFVISSLNGGGAQRVLISLANHFAQLQCEVVVIALNYEEPSYAIDKRVEVVYLLNERRPQLWHRAYCMFQTFFKLTSLLHKKKPDCAVAFITSANLWTGITCSLAGVPFIVSERTSPNRTVNQFNFLLKRIAAILYKKSSAVVVSAKGVEDCMLENNAFKNLTNISRITNAVPVFKTPSDTRVHNRRFILGVGRLAFVKGFDQLIAAYHLAGVRDADLLIVGDGEERDNLIVQIASLGLSDRVKLLGSKPNLQDYYSQAEIFVLPSRNEGYPNALVEAMSLGCPSIAMDCEFGPSEIIDDGRNGLLVKDNTVIGLSEMISTLIDDPALKANLSKEAGYINYTNSADRIFKKWENLILKHA